MSAQKLSPEENSVDSGLYLRWLAWSKLREIQPVAAWDYDDPYRKRLKYELDTIVSLGFADYFLVMADIINAAKAEGIRIGPGRGSAGGSLVAYVIGITALDPIPRNLLFERFLNPERVSLPDIDIDVQDKKRERLLEIIREKYGADCTVQLGTHGRIGAKKALKDAGRVLGMPFVEAQKLTYNLPAPKMGFSPTLEEYSGDRDTDVYRLACGVEGTIYSESVHAAGVIVAPEPLRDQIPLRLQTGKGSWISGFEMGEIEALGLVKQDYLGLKTLQIIDDCLRLAKETTGEIHLPEQPADCTDRKTYELLSTGETLGVFQLDSPGMRGLLRKLKPSTFDDISAVLALYRPGPMGVNAHLEFCNRRYRPIHSELEADTKSILEPTYGLIVFQEQVLEVLAAVAGYTYGTAEGIFNALRKKKLDQLEQQKPDLVARMTARGYSEDAIETLWNVLLPFASYSFNRSHTDGYGLVAYWTAYLKANHPNEFMAATLSNENNSSKEERERFNGYLAECEKLGVTILPPDINDSLDSFTPTAYGVRYGLSAIKGVGKSAVTAVAKKRPYRSMTDYFTNVPAAGLNVGVVGSLCQAGAFDSLCSREGLERVIDAHCQRASEARKAKQSGQRGLSKPRFTVKSEPVDLKKRRQWETETIGMAITQPVVVAEMKDSAELANIDWLRSVAGRNRGRAPLRIRIGDHAISVDYKVEPEGFVREAASNTAWKVTEAAE